MLDHLAHENLALNETQMALAISEIQVARAAEALAIKEAQVVQIEVALATKEAQEAQIEEVLVINLDQVDLIEAALRIKAAVVKTSRSIQYHGKEMIQNRTVQESPLVSHSEENRTEDLSLILSLEDTNQIEERNPTIEPGSSPKTSHSASFARRSLMALLKEKVLYERLSAKTIENNRTQNF